MEKRRNEPDCIRNRKGKIELMKNSIFSSVNLPSPEMAKVKTPSEVKKENQENPTTKEKRLNKMINTEQANFDTLILKPKTRHNKIQLLKSQITLFYLIEKMPKMNKSKVKKITTKSRFEKSAFWFFQEHS